MREQTDNCPPTMESQRACRLRSDSEALAPGSRRRYFGDWRDRSYLLRFIRVTVARKSAWRSANGVSEKPRCGITTMSRPGPAGRDLLSRKISRTSRFARLRHAAPPRRRVAIIPRRLTSRSFANEKIVAYRPLVRTPCLCTRRNSGRRRIRSRRVRPLFNVNCLFIRFYETARRFRPFARRLCRIRRPFFVLIRFKNP